MNTAMVSSSYLVGKPSPPSGLKRFFDQRIIPAAIDGAAYLDVSIANAAHRLRRNPKIGLGLLGMGILLAVRLSRRPQRS
jgi:hypothetical protein